MKSIKKKLPKQTQAPILLDKAGAHITPAHAHGKNFLNAQIKNGVLCMASLFAMGVDISFVSAAENITVASAEVAPDVVVGVADATQFQNPNPNTNLNPTQIQTQTQVQAHAQTQQPEVAQKAQEAQQSQSQNKNQNKNQPQQGKKNEDSSAAAKAFSELADFQKQDMRQALLKTHDIQAQEIGKIYTEGQAITGQFDQNVTIIDAQAWLNDAYIKAHSLDFDMLQQKIFANSDLKPVDAKAAKAAEGDGYDAYDGQVYFKTADITARAKTANYDLEAKTAELSEVFYILSQAQEANEAKEAQEKYAKSSKNASANINTNANIDTSLTGTLQKGLVGDGQNLGHGYAKSLKMPNPQNYTAENISHSFCPINDRVWHLNAKNLTIDQRQDRMRIKDAKLVVGDTALAYFPYLDIPMRGQNQSGFLIPEAAVNSRTGFDVSLPYYFALSPSYDATVTPRILSKRGLQTAGEFRYLLDNMQGQAQADILLHDWQNKKNRWRYRIDHLQRLSTPAWLPDANLQINWQKVSDDDYPQDLGRDINQSTTRIYPQRVELSGLLNHNLLGKEVVEGDWRLWHQRYQTLKPNLAPYNQDIAFEVEQKADLNKWLNKPILDNTFLNWQHQTVHLNNPDLTVAQNKKATRMVNHINLTKRWQNDAFFSEPSVKLQHVQYFGDLIGVDQKPVQKNILVPTFKWDAGLFLERKVYQKEDQKAEQKAEQNIKNIKNIKNIGDAQEKNNPLNKSALNTNALNKHPFRIQILEPRLMYSYTPYRAQNSPIFDAAEPEFGFSSLFNEQRYIGHDRISDQHQLTMGVAFSALNQKAQEDFWLNIGQRYQFNDSKVSLNNMPNERLNRGFSDVLLQARAMKYKTLSSDFDAQYNPKQSKLIKLNLGLNWQPNDDYLMKLNYRYRKNSPLLNQSAIKQLAFESKFKIKDNWRLSTYTSYDLENKRLSQAIAGIEYAHPCWRLKVGVDRTITTNNQYTTKAIIKISLNGLGN